ncbi:hypothetical protein [Azospirillum thiophilum]|nr:hypothetical protein [Azospirillum thiophilum]
MMPNLEATDWRVCHAARFDSPGEVRRIQFRLGERLVILAVGEVPVVCDIIAPGVYTVDIPAHYPRASFPVLVVAVPSIVAYLLAHGGPTKALPAVPLADPHTGGARR